MALSVDPARAEAALNERLGDRRAQLGDSIAKLAKAREDMRRSGLTPTTVGLFYMRAHDLKSLGALCGFPVVSRLATAICTLFDDASHIPAEQMGLVDDHLDAIGALFDKGVATEDDPRAGALLDELDRDLRER